MQAEIRTKLQKALKGAIIAGSGVAFTYFLQEIGQMDFGNFTPVVAGLSSVFINAVRLFTGAPHEQ